MTAMIIEQMILTIAVLVTAVAQATLAVVGMLTATVVIGAVAAYVAARLAFVALARTRASERRAHGVARRHETSRWASGA